MVVAVVSLCMVSVKHSSGKLFSWPGLRSATSLAIGSPLRSLVDGGPWGLRVWRTVTAVRTQSPAAAVLACVPVADAEVAKGLTVSATEAVLVQRLVAPVPRHVDVVYVVIVSGVSALHLTST